MTIIAGAVGIVAGAGGSRSGGRGVRKDYNTNRVPTGVFESFHGGRRLIDWYAMLCHYVVEIVGTRSKEQELRRSRGQRHEGMPAEVSSKSCKLL